MAEEAGKILKVTVEHESATFTVEGKDAEKWREWVNFIESIAKHYGHEQSFNWTKIEELA